MGKVLMIICVLKGVVFKGVEFLVPPLTIGFDKLVAKGCGEPYYVVF